MSDIRVLRIMRVECNVYAQTKMEIRNHAFCAETDRSNINVLIPTQVDMSRSKMDSLRNSRPAGKCRICIAYTLCYCHWKR